MWLERITFNEFIRGHCGSVTIEAPSDRAIGAERQVNCRRSIFKRTQAALVLITLSGKSSRQGCACFPFYV